jgi:isopentenyl-diphosphate delta-isomerase
MKNNKFEVVDENDEVIGLEEKEIIRKKGLLLRITLVWFFTPKGEIILQHRSPNKDIHPDKLDATVGGKVEPGHSYEETAILETAEEAGVIIRKEELIQLFKIKRNVFDEARGINDRNFTMHFAYCYKGDIKDLKIEEGKSLGFEVWSVDKILSLPEEQKKFFINDLVEEPNLTNIFKEIKKLIK